MGYFSLIEALIFKKMRDALPAPRGGGSQRGYISTPKASFMTRFHPVGGVSWWAWGEPLAHDGHPGADGALSTGEISGYLRLRWCGAWSPVTRRGDIGRGVVGSRGESTRCRPGGVSVG